MTGRRPWTPGFMRVKSCQMNRCHFISRFDSAIDKISEVTLSLFRVRWAHEGVNDYD